jgi:flagellar M-ring protein FliF
VDVRDRLAGFVQTLPLAHTIGIVSALAVLAMASVLFVQWITTPAYTVLYTGMDDAAVANVIGELDALGVPYQLEGGGSRVMVPRSQLYTTRAALASAGVGGATSPAGYELLDNQGLSISDFRQRVDYQRALEGELARTLMAMEGIDRASVHLALPEEELFSERQQPATASVLIGTTRNLSEPEIEAITFLVSSSVEGLDSTNITVADARGTVLHAPGDGAGSTAVTSRHMRQTREFEEALSADLSRLLGTVTNGTPASVVVRATLNYDEAETQTETFNPASQVALREQLSVEQYDGTGIAPGGVVGVDGGPLGDIAGGESTYAKDEQLREYGVDRTTARTITAPGRVERLSVAIVMDDGTETGAVVPEIAAVEQLVGAALQLDPARGDAIAVSQLPLPAPAELEVLPEEQPTLLDLLPQIVAVIVLLLVGLALFLMSRRRKAVEALPVATPTRIAPTAPELLGGDETEALEPDPVADMQSEVAELVQRQPEEIAVLLRGWLADRRSA